MKNLKTRRIYLILAFLLTTVIAMADSDVSAELKQQNTPSGWTAVQLPNIAAITNANTFNITSYGASTGSSDNSSAINQAITAANTAGGGMVVIPSGTWLSGPITMKSNVVLHMSKNCTLKVLPFKGFNQNVSAGEPYYPVTGWTSTTKDGKTTYSSTLVNFINNGGVTVNDIIIEGEGETSVIEGQGEPWWELRDEIGDYTRPNLIRIEKGARHLFRNFKTHNSMSQNIVLGRSGNANNITVHGITIDNPSSEASTPSHNTDGFPIWGPYVNIYDCNISTGDDNIVCDSKAHHIHAWNITCGDGHGMSIGSYTSELHDVIYEGITFNGTGSGFRIKTNADRSGNDQTGTNGAVKNIICRNATMTGCPSPIKITSWYDKDVETPSNNPTSDVSATTPEFCDVLFQNITANAVSGKTSWKHNRPIYLYGRPEMYIHDVTFDNVKINSVLGMFMAFSKNITFKNGCKIVNEKNSGSLLTTEYNAYSDNGSTLLSANASKYNGSESATTYPVTFKNGSETYKTYNICPNSYAYPPTDPTKSNATFLGWATSEGGTPVTLAQTQLATGGTFYAVWENGEQGGEEVIETIYSLQVNNGQTLGLNSNESSQLSTEATITGGTATVHNGKSTRVDNMVSSGAVNLGGSSGSYLKITLSNNTFKAGDVITVTNAGNYKISNTNSDASTVTFPYTVTSSDAINGKSDLYIWKTGISGDPSSIKTVTVTRDSNSGDTPGDDDPADDVIEGPDPAPVAVKPAAKKGFDFIVGKDGTIDEAIAAANAWTGSGRYLIFVPDGTYKLTGNASFKTKDSYDKNSDHTYYRWDEATGKTTSGLWNTSTTYTDNGMTWLTKSNVSIVGQSMDGTVLYNIPYIWGISYTSTLEIRSGYSNTYLQDFTLKNMYAGGANDKGVAVAFYDRGTNTIAKNLNAWSNQDTYTSAATRCYYETSRFSGTVDFICGSGDVWFEQCDLVINNRGGNVITAPSTLSTEDWGYVFNHCTISKAAGATLVTDKNWNLGRPWKVAPASTFLYTKMNVLPSDAAWTDMNDGLAIRFHEYGSTNSSGTLLDLSKRSVSACAGTTADKPVLTEAQASHYKVSSVLSGDNSWDPRALALQTTVSNVQLSDNTLSWDANDYALCWIVFKDGVYYANPTTNSLALTEYGTYTVRAANSMGGLGEASAEVVYEDLNATYTVTYNLKGHGNAIAPVTDVTALPATLPTPTADGYAFWGWYTDDACTVVAVANAEIRKNTTLYAKWTDASTASGKWSIDFSTIGDTERLADKAGVAISGKVARINGTDMGVIKMGNTYVDNHFVIQTGTSWIYRTAQKAIYSSNGGNRSFGMRNMKAGQTITMTLTDVSSITPTNATLTSSENNIWVYNVTADGDVSFNINRYSYIYSIDVEPKYHDFSMTTPSTTPSNIGNMEVEGGSISDESTNTKALTFDGNGVKFGSGYCKLKITLTDNIVAGATISVKYKNTSTTNTTGLGVFDSNSANAVINLANNIASSASGTQSYTFTSTDASYIGKKELIITRNGGSGGLAISEITVTFPTSDVPTTYAISEDISYSSFAEGTYDVVTLKRTFPRGEWTTLVLPFDVTKAQLIETFPDPTNSEVAVVTKLQNDKLYFKTQDHINANEPVLIYLSQVNNDNVYTFRNVTVQNAAEAKYEGATDVTMTGTYQTIDGHSLTANDYFIGGGKFYDCTYLSIMKPFRGYFSAPVAGGKLSLFIGDESDDATAVEAVEAVQMVNDDEPVYNLAGQRMKAGMAKGLMIRGHRKFVVR